jgi:heme-degrading monooxygenase HmoA
VILEVAALDVRPGLEDDFERAFAEARTVIAESPGFMSLDLQRSVERPGRYLLLVRWETLEDHTVGFRRGPLYPRWKALLHHFYDPFPVVEHFRPV